MVGFGQAFGECNVTEKSFWGVYERNRFVCQSIGMFSLCLWKTKLSSIQITQVISKQTLIETSTIFIVQVREVLFLFSVDGNRIMLPLMAVRVSTSKWDLVCCMWNSKEWRLAFCCVLSLHDTSASFLFHPQYHSYEIGDQTSLNHILLWLKLNVAGCKAATLFSFHLQGSLMELLWWLEQTVIVLKQLVYQYLNFRYWMKAISCLFLKSYDAAVSVRKKSWQKPLTCYWCIRNTACTCQSLSAGLVSSAWAGQDTFLLT